MFCSRDSYIKDANVIILNFFCVRFDNDNIPILKPFGFMHSRQRQIVIPIRIVEGRGEMPDTEGQLLQIDTAFSCQFFLRQVPINFFITDLLIDF